MLGLVLLTTACPIECDHCQYSCTASKEPSKWMPEKTIRRVAEEFTKNDIHEIKISGGEPFYEFSKLVSAVKILSKFYNPNGINIATSGFWACNKNATDEKLKILKECGIKWLEVSIDRFHLRRVPLANVENILREAEKFEIKMILRPLLDIKSAHLVKAIAKLVIKYKPIILFSVTDPIGKAEKFDKQLIGTNEVLSSFVDKIKIGEERFKNKMVFPTNPKVVTAFPNGNVYGCCIAAKLTYMGNIKRESLASMINDFNKTIPGYVFCNGMVCSYLNNFLPPKAGICEFCENQPFEWSRKIQSEYVGKKFISLNLDKLEDIDVKKEFDGKHDILLSFKLAEENLNKETGEKFLDFLNELKQNNIRFKLSKPLPPCLGKIKIDDDQPQNCFECREMFTVEDGVVKLCEPMKNKKVGLFEDMKNREQIYGYFLKEHGKMGLIDTCKKCVYVLRKQCNGLCNMGD